MPTLDWIGKDKVINHHLDVPYRVLDKQYTYGADESANMIIHGDNLLALKSLLPKYEGKIDCVYIDPPYNTGTKEGKWVYSDNVDDPIIKKWLNEVVGAEGEDLSRHDKWLCMMYPRLRLLQRLLSPEGLIFISIDDNEQSNLKLLCDEIFGKNRFVGTYFWKKTETPPSLSYKIRRKLEYVICYEKTSVPQRIFSQGKVDGGDAPLLNGGNPLGTLVFPEKSVRFNIPDGEYSASDDKKIELIDTVIVKNGINQNAFSARAHFKWGQTNLNEEIKNGTYFLVKSQQFSIRYQKSEKAEKIPSNIIDADVGVSTNEQAKKELKALGVTGEISFDYAKPVSLIEYLLRLGFYDRKDFTVLDSFAGSGTTAHAVLNMNLDGGTRTFILVEMMEYAKTITAERVKRVITGYSNGIDNSEPLGGDFSYYELGEPLLIDNEYLNEAVGIERIREYIFFMETKEAISQSTVDDNAAYLGAKNGVGYYFNYDKDKTTTLDFAFLKSITQKFDGYIIYADKCVLSEKDLLRYNITFKKIPRDITRL